MVVRNVIVIFCSDQAVIVNKMHTKSSQPPLYLLYIPGYSCVSNPQVEVVVSSFKTACVRFHCGMAFKL